MASPYEHVRTRYELFSPLDAITVEMKRDELTRLYAGRTLIDANNPAYMTDNPVNDVMKIRFDGMTPYVDSVMERMRTGEVIDIKISPTTAAKDIFDKIAEQDGHVRPALFVRYIHALRLPIALETGTDRDSESKRDYHGGYNEKQAMAEYAVCDPTDLTYITDITPDDRPMSLVEGQALLVYAVEALQPLTPYKKDRHGSIGIAAFVDKRLKERSLLAILRNPADHATTSGNVAVAGLAKVVKERA